MATVPSWCTAAAKNLGPEASRVGMPGGHTRVSKSVDDGDVGTCWECCTQHVGKNEGKNLGKKHLELSERRRAFAPKKRRGKQAGRKTARKKHKTTRARSRLKELTFGTFNVRKAAVNGANGIGHIDTLLRPSASNDRDVIGLQETKRDGTSEIGASGYRIFFSGDSSVVKRRKGQYGVGLAI